MMRAGDVPKSLIMVLFVAALAAPASSASALVRLPDLVTRSVTAGVAAGKVHARATVANVGTRRASSSRAGVFLSLDKTRGSTDPRLGTAPVGGLVAGASARVDVTVGVPVSVRRAFYHVIVCADVAKAVTELREANNCAASVGTVHVGTPRVAISASAGAGGSVAASGVTAGTCSAGTCSFPAGTGTVTFTATPHDTYRFGGWSGTSCTGFSGSATDPSITFTHPTTPHLCAATFVKTYTVRWSSYNSWALVSGCDSAFSTEPGSCTVDAGTTVILTAKPTGPTFAFTGQWDATNGLPCDGASSLGGDGSGSMTFTAISGDKSCEAHAGLAS